jgi:KDO2-lipid IV(A) lauroyltransferase
MKMIIGALSYVIAWTLVRLIQALPLDLAARLGRAAGAGAWVIDARHRRVATKNLTQCFGREMTGGQIRAIAREHFRRLGETYFCAVKTSAMSWTELRSRVDIVGPPWILTRTKPSTPVPSLVAAIGHFGNFELYAHFGNFNPDYECATTYRGVKPAALNRLLQSLRATSGCHFFERRTELAALKNWMKPTGRMLGFLADQHAGRSGVRTPFFGVDCATTTAPVVFALRYRLPLVVGFCFRTSLARWRIEFSGEVATHQQGQPRPVEDIVIDMNRLFEAAIRRDPANWFWVHNRWKADKLPAARAEKSARQNAGFAKAAPTLLTDEDDPDSPNSDSDSDSPTSSTPAASSGA